MPDKIQAATTAQPAAIPETPQSEMLDIINEKISKLEHEASQTEPYIRKHAPVLSVLAFVIVAMFTWYQQTQQHDTRIALLEQRQGELQALNVESRLTKIETTVADFKKQQLKANDRIQGMLETILSRDNHHEH